MCRRAQRNPCCLPAHVYWKRGMDSLPCHTIHALRLPQYNASRIGHIVALGAQQCVRELQRQAPQGESTVAACNALCCRAALRCARLPQTTHHPAPNAWLHSGAAAVVVLALLPMEPMMLHAPQRIFGPMVAAANAELQQYVAAQGSERLKFRGGLGALGCLWCTCNIAQHC